MFGRSSIPAHVVTERCVRVPAPPGGLRQIGSDPMKVVNDAMEESSNLLGAVLSFAASLVAPEEDKGTVRTHKLWSPDKFSGDLQITAVEERSGAEPSSELRGFIVVVQRNWGTALRSVTDQIKSSKKYIKHK